MPEKLTPHDLLRVLRGLGRALAFPASLTLGGSSALLLTGALDRLTDDLDVLDSSVEFPRLLEAIRRVEVVEHAPPGWLNPSIQTYRDALPPGYRARLVAVPRMERLDVSLLSRPDVLAMKLYAGRPRDMQDILAVRPSAADLDFMQADIARVAVEEPDRATAMLGRIADVRYVLRDGESPPDAGPVAGGPSAPSVPPPPSPRRRGPRP